MQDLALTWNQLLWLASGGPLREGLSWRSLGWGSPRGEELSEVHGVMVRERHFR